ncbi:MAG: hypothetical protein R2824_27345 [Saprospiraceae bacterium]|nr:hypothetical protein [Lewinella sp.]
MTLETIKDNLIRDAIFHSEPEIMGLPSVVGYEKKFKWSWMATQLNTFIVATDFGEEEITRPLIEEHLTEAFYYAEDHYKGWPRGLQSGVGVISVLLSDEVDAGAKEFCLKLKAGKKWAGFTIPVVLDCTANEIFYFEKNPMWGRIYFPHFRKLIERIQ